MLIILDGPDGAGKSTLAEAISVATSGHTQVIHRSSVYTTPHLLIEYTAPLADYDPASGENLVLDRWHLSEKVYGDLHRGGCKLSPVAWAAVDALLDNLGAIVVIVHAPIPTLVARLLARGEEVDVEALTREHTMFKQASHFTKLPTYWADTSRHTTADLTTSVVAAATRREHNAVH